MKIINNNSLTSKIVKSALMAAIYVVVTLAFQFMSYGPIQFRISEILILLVIINPTYTVGLTIGCLLANFASGYGIHDLILGPLATLISCIFINITVKKIKGTKGIIIASLWPAIFNGLIIGIMIHVLSNAPLLLTMGQVAFGEFVVITIIGIPIFKKVLLRLKKVL